MMQAVNIQIKNEKMKKICKIYKLWISKTGKERFIEVYKRSSHRINNI